MDEPKDYKIERQKYQLHKKGYEDITKAISELKEKPEVQKVQLLGAEIVTIKGEKGDKPSKEELEEIINPLIPTEEDLKKIVKPLIPSPIPGKDGKDYVLTEANKTEIAKKIKVPIVEKIIEKTETIIEKPTITEITKEVAKYEDTEAIVNKLKAHKKKWLSIDAIDGDFNTKIRQIGNKVVGISSLKHLTDVDYSGLSQDANGNYILGSGGGSSVWGGITGTLSNQTDLQNALDLKANIADLGAVAFSNDYNDLSNKPTIPTGTIDGTLTSNELVYSVDSNTVGSLAVATYPSLTEISYVKGVTSAIQTQLNAKGTFTLPSLTNGSVLFSNGSTIAQDNANFFWDDTNNRLGIGTINPRATLHSFLAGGGSSYGPTGTTIIGQNSTSGNSSYLTLVGGYDAEAGIVFTDESQAYKGKIGYSNSSEGMYFNTDGSEKMRILSTGNVGIGGTPSYPLDVITGTSFSNGGIRTKYALRFGTNTSSAPVLFSFSGSSQSTPNEAGQGLSFYSYANTNGNIGIAFTGDSVTTTASSYVNAQFVRGFLPSSGNADFTTLNVRPTINQTGGANGITRGIYINPTLTSAADFRAIQLDNSSGYGIYQSNAGASNYFAGDVSVPDEVYGAGWNGNTEVPTKNAVYDKIEGLSSVYQPLDTQLTSVAGLSYTGNAGKFIRVNAGETDFELATVSGSGTVTSVAMSVPTGLTVTGSPVTTTGTLAVALDTGYVIPLQTTLDGYVKTDQTVGQTIGTTGARLTKLWATDITVTNAITGSVTGNAGTATALQNARTIGGVSFDGTANITVATATGGFTVSGGALALGSNNLTMTGSLGATGAGKATKVWTVDLESTNMPTVNGTSLSSTFQPLDSDLTTIAGLTATTDNFIVSVSSAWASRTPSQVRTTLGLVIGTNVQAWDADLDTWATKTAPSGTVLGTTDTQTVTNKRIQPRTASSTTSSNLSPDLSTANVYYRTTQTATLTIDAPTGTPVIGETIMIYVDSAGSQTLTINGTYVPFGAAFPATTTAGKTFMMSCQYNGSAWNTLWANKV